MDAALTHLDPEGHGRMVDVSAKPVTARRAVASARVTMSSATRARALAGDLPKGAVIEVARIAGIQAAKRTAELIPFCHPLPLDAVEVRIAPEGEAAFRIEAEARATWRTGVEMEALTAAAIAALTLVDMLKAVDRSLVVSELRLESKSGGRSGSWQRPP